MKIVARCPICKQKIRFPINKGKLLLRCPRCKNQFMFDLSIKRLWYQLVYRFRNWIVRLKKIILKK